MTAEKPVCSECASSKVEALDQDRGKAWLCSDCGCYWGYVDGVSAFDWHYSKAEMEALEITVGQFNE